LSQLMSPQSDFRLEARVFCSCGFPFAEDSAFCKKCGQTRSEACPPDSQDSIDRDLNMGMADMAGPPPPTGPVGANQRLLSPMILRCREIMAAPPQEGVPAQQIPDRLQVGAPSQRIPVMRSTSAATTVPTSGPPVPIRQDVMQPEVAQSEASISPAPQSVSPTVADISPSIPSLSPSIPSISPVCSLGESLANQYQGRPPTEPSLTPSSVVQRATAAMLRAGVEPPPMYEGGGALRSRPLPGGAPPSIPPAPGPGKAPPTTADRVRSGSPGLAPPQQSQGKEADRGGGPVVVRTLTESASEATSMQSTTAPSSSQASAKMHGMPGQVKPPPIPRISRDPPGSSSEVLVAHVPMSGGVQGLGSPGGPVHLSPLVRIREDRMSGIASPQSLTGSGVQRQSATPPQQDQ